MHCAATLLFCIALLAGGCTRHAVVRIETGPDAEIETISIETSSGDNWADDTAIRASRNAFPGKIRYPRRNHVYIQPVDIKDCWPVNWSQ